MIELIKGIALGTAQGGGGGGAPINNEDLTITANGTYTASEGYTGIGTATVNVGSLVENFDIQGTPTFSGDAKLGTRAVSGLSASNYLTTKDVVDWGAGAWNIHFRFIHKASSGTQALIANSTNVGSQGISATITNNVFKLFLSSNGSSNDILNGGSSSYTFSDGVEYDLDIWFTGGAYGFTALPHNSSAGTSESLVTSSSTLYTSSLVKAIGNNLTGSTNFFQGTIYLDDLTIHTNAFDWVAEEVLGEVKKYGATINNFLGDVDANGVLQKPTASNLVFSGVEDLSEGCLSYAYYIPYGSNQGGIASKSITSVSFPDLTQITHGKCLQYAFQFQESLTSISFPKLETINSKTVSGEFSSAFFGTNITKAEFPKLKTISSFYGVFDSAFNACKLLTEISFPELETCSGRSCFSYAFYACGSLTQASFPKLKTVGRYCFQSAFGYCSSLESVSFPALNSTSFGYNTDQFNLMLKNVTGCTVHFPSNLQSVIGSWSDVTNGFGGTNTTVLFDLPATE